jgi:isocitrate dehydrogenase kinase/phosphatase
LRSLKASLIRSTAACSNIENLTPEKLFVFSSQPERIGAISRVRCRSNVHCWQMMYRRLLISDLLTELPLRLPWEDRRVIRDYITLGHLQQSFSAQQLACRRSRWLMSSFTVTRLPGWWVSCGWRRGSIHFLLPIHHNDSGAYVV